MAAAILFKGVVALSVSEKIRNQIDKKGLGQAQITIAAPGVDDLGLKKAKQALVALYRIPESKKVTKDCLIGTFVQADTHSLWRAHQSLSSLEAYSALLAQMTPAPQGYYAVMTSHISVGTIGDLTELEVEL
jgi:hypothetical protein